MAEEADLRSVRLTPPRPATAEVELENVFVGVRRPLLGQGTTYPWKYLCLLSTTWPDRPATLGTGWLISAQTVITAGHNLFRPGHPGVVCASVRVALGYDGSAPPLVTSSGADLRIAGGWQQGDSRADVGAVRLSFPLGAPFGPDFLEPIVTPPDPVACTVAGYPKDLVPFGLYCDSGTTRRNADGLLEHHISTEDGESGAPLLWQDGDRYRALGVHVWGDPTHNLALPFSEAVVATLRSWA